MSREPSQRRRTVPRWVSWLGWWASLMTMWVVLAGSFDPAELLAGAVAAVLSATAAVAVLFPGVERFDGEARWLLGLWRLPREALLDTGRLFRALWGQLARGKPVRGRFRTVAFRHGGEGADDMARRACTTTAGSFAPNAYVVGIDRADHVVLYHELVHTEDQTACDPLRLG